jgi:hypothetical protein
METRLTPPPVLDVFIGYDTREVVAYHVLCQSILQHSTRPVRFTPLALSNLKEVFDRPPVSVQSTEFSFSRFLTPYLSGYQGWSLFMDCDMLLRADIAELFACADDRYAVMACQHNYTPRDEIKFLDRPQVRYDKKNWSSVMLFNNARCRKLTPEFVQTASGLDLHQFKWLADEGEIGALDLEWNWLVGEYDFNPRVKNAHFTIGGPWFDEYRDSDYAGEWLAALARVDASDQRAAPARTPR